MARIKNRDDAEIPKSAEDKKRLLTRNKRLSYVIALTHNVGFLTPVWVIFGTDHLGLSLTLSLVLGSTGWVSSSLFEVPMGAFADRYGRKLSLILGFGLCAIADLSLVFLDQFWILMFFQLFAGVGYALTSGSLEGLLHDTFEEQGESTAYAKLSSQMLSLLHISRIATVPVGAWLYEMNTGATLSSFTWPYIASFFSYMISFSCVLFLFESRSSHKTPEKISDNSVLKITSKVFSHVGVTWNAMMKNLDVKRVLFILGLYALIGEGNWALYQQYFKDNDISVSSTGWIYMVLSLCMALGARYVAIIYKKINVMWAMNLIILSVSLSMILFRLPIQFAIVGFIIIALVGPMCWYLQDNAIQNRMEGDQKTTALSISSMAYNIGATIGVFGGGAIADHYGVTRAQWIFVAYGLVVFVGISLWCLRDGFSVREEDARATAETSFDDVPQVKP